MPTPSEPATTRHLSVEAARLSRWLSGFTERHGATTWSASAAALVVTAADGSVAEIAVPFPPLVVSPDEPYAGLLDHATADRRVGVLLVRLGGFAAGVFEGARLVSSKVGSRPVHGRSAAGGQSQKRFARRREGQVRVALTAAIEVADRVLVPETDTLDAVVLGGDRQSLVTVLDDVRLAPLRRLVVEPTLDVPDPRLKVLESTPALFRSVRIAITEPA